VVRRISMSTFTITLEVCLFLVYLKALHKVSYIVK